MLLTQPISTCSSHVNSSQAINPTCDFHRIPGSKNQTNITIVIKVMELPLDMAALDAPGVASYFVDEGKVTPEL
jgi:hypothetical protein